MLTIAVDAMGGDHAPKAEVEGAILAARHHDVEVVLVGREPELRAELSRHRHHGLPIRIVPASEVIVGDLLVLAEGDDIPADARVVEEYGLRTNNANLTVAGSVSGAGVLAAGAAAFAGVVAISPSTATTVPPVTRKSRLEYFFFAAASSLSAFLPPGIGLLLREIFILNVMVGWTHRQPLPKNPLAGWQAPM